MTFTELEEFIEFVDGKLRAASYAPKTERESVMARTIKLGEEYGELCNEVLGFLGDQRKEKLEDHSVETLKDEFADVIITTLLLAKSMDIQVTDALGQKILKLKDRFGA